MFTKSEKAPLPSSSPVKYGGMNGNTLLYAIVATATCGFSLFGRVTSLDFVGHTLISQL
jgi:hypothetical protein